MSKRIFGVALAIALFAGSAVVVTSTPAEAYPWCYVGKEKCDLQ